MKKNPDKFDSMIPVSKQIFAIAVPVVLQNMAFYVMTFINSAFIGHYDINALSTINNVMMPYMMLFTLLIALSQGTTVLIAQAIGAKDRNAAIKIAESSIYYIQIVSIGYCLFWLFFGKYVLLLMGVSDNIMKAGIEYIQVFSLIFLTGGLNIASGAIFQGIGKTRPIMNNTILRAVLNIILDYCLIFGNFGFPRMGLTGAAVASLISATICNLLLFRSVMKNGILDISIRGILKPQRGVYKKVFIFGAQAGLEMMLWNAAQVALIRMLNMNNEIFAGMYGIINMLISLSFNLYIGIGTASMTLVGNRFGAKRMDLVPGIGNLCGLYSLLLCLAVSTIFIIVPDKMIKIFTTDSNVVNDLVVLIPLVIAILFPKSVNVVIGNSIKGIGHVRWMLLTQTIGTIVTIALAWYLVFNLKLGLKGVIIANVADESWRAVANYIKFYFVTKIPAVKNDFPCTECSKQLDAVQ